MIENERAISIIRIHILDNLLLGYMEVHFDGRGCGIYRLCYLVITEFIIIAEVECSLLLRW